MQAVNGAGVRARLRIEHGAHRRLDGVTGLPERKDAGGRRCDSEVFTGSERGQRGVLQGGEYGGALRGFGAGADVEGGLHVVHLKRSAKAAGAQRFQRRWRCHERGR